MNQIQRATNIVEGRILNSLEAQEDLNKNKQEFISEFVKNNRKQILNDTEVIATILANTDSDEQYLRLFDCIAEWFCTANGKPLAAIIDDIIDYHLELQAENQNEITRYNVQAMENNYCSHMTNKDKNEYRNNIARYISHSVASHNELVAEVERLRKFERDAMRYRFLRDNCTTQQADSCGPIFVMSIRQKDNLFNVGLSIDEAMNA